MQTAAAAAAAAAASTDTFQRESTGRFLRWKLDLQVVLRNVAFLSVELRLTPLLFEVYNLPQTQKRAGSVPRSWDEGLRLRSSTNLQDVALPEAQLVVRRCRELVLPSGFHREVRRGRAERSCASFAGASLQGGAERQEVLEGEPFPSVFLEETDEECRQTASAKHFRV